MLSKLRHQSSRFYVFTGTSIAFGVISACLLVPTLWSSSLQLAKVADIEAGKLPTSNWVVIDDGKLLWNDAFQMIGGFSRQYIVPVVSSEWQTGQPVSAFAVVSVEEGGKMGDYETIQGICVLTGLDSEIKKQIDGHVSFKAAERHIMVQHGTDPGMDRNLGLVLCGICFLTAVAAVFLYNDAPKSNKEPVSVTPDVAVEPEPAPAEAVAVEAVPDTSAAETNTGDISAWLRERGIDYEDNKS